MTATAPRMLFVCGFPSSGTDLLKNLLNAHGDIFIGGEFPLLPALAGRYGATVSPAEKDAAIRDLAGSDVYHNLSRRDVDPGLAFPASFAQLYAHMLSPKNAAWVGNKTPQNSENVDRLDRLFPEARYILIVRDVRDVALSWKRKWGKDPCLCAYKWNARMLHARRLLERIAPGRHVVVTYESLLADERATATRICEFLGLAYDERMGEYHRFVGAKVAGKLNYGEPVIRANTQKWREGLARRTIERIEEIAFEAMRSFGYESEYARQSRPITLPGKVGGNLRDIFSMMATGNTAQRGGSRFAYIRSVVSHELAKRFGRYRVLRS